MQKGRKEDSKAGVGGEKRESYKTSGLETEQKIFFLGHSKFVQFKPQI